MGYKLPTYCMTSARTPASSVVWNSDGRHSVASGAPSRHEVKRHSHEVCFPPKRKTKPVSYTHLADNSFLMSNAASALRQIPSNFETWRVNHDTEYNAFDLSGLNNGEIDNLSNGRGSIKVCLLYTSLGQVTFCVCHIALAHRGIGGILVCRSVVGKLSLIHI